MTEKVEAVERARARARRPGPNFWLAVNKAPACGSTSIVFKKPKEGSSLDVLFFISTKLRLKVGSREIC